MTVNELLELLQDQADAGMGEVEVLIAHQPHYPLALTVAGVAGPFDDNLDEDGMPAPGKPAVWIVDGGRPEDRSPYAPEWPFAVAS